MRKTSVAVLLGLCLSGWMPVSGAETETAVLADPRSGAPADETELAVTPSNATVVTSARLTFDQQQRQAVFEENVVVTDRELKITADRLVVFFDEDNHVSRIECEGAVTIVRQDLVATGARAVYEIKESKMQLVGNPRIVREQDVLSGETITLWRDSKRILCEPNARLVIRSEQDVTRQLKQEQE